MTYTSYIADAFAANGMDTQLQGFYSLSGRKSYRKITKSLEAAILNVIVMVSPWNLTSNSTALLPMCLSNFRVIEKV